MQREIITTGICVRQVYNDEKLPFEDNSYNVKEVNRILKPNGIFITQQVGGKNNEILSNRLIKNFQPKYPYLNLNYAVDELERSSFKVLHKNECFPYLHFYDVGAIVYYAKIIEWEFPGFSVDSCLDELWRIYEELKKKPYIESYEHRFIVAAKNIKNIEVR